MVGCLGKTRVTKSLLGVSELHRSTLQGVTAATGMTIPLEVNFVTCSSLFENYDTLQTRFSALIWYTSRN